MQKARKRWSVNEIILFVMAFCGVAMLVVFCYLPMFGIVLAFKDGDGALDILKAITDSRWVGFANFKKFFQDPGFGEIIWNTLGLNCLQLLINFPAPIIFALLLSEMPHRKFKSTVQVISYMPYFLSWAVFGGIVLSFLDPQTGLINDLFVKIGIFKEPVNFGEARYFWGTIIISSIIKGLGWGAIIYIAAIAGVDQQLFEAARIDGANRFQRILYITLPSIAGTITLFFILSVSGILNNGFEAFYILQNSINLSKSEVLDTFIYKKGIQQMRYSYTTAIGFFKSLVAIVLLTSTHFLSKRLTGRGMF